MDPGPGVCLQGDCFWDPQTVKNRFFSPVSFPSVSCHPVYKNECHFRIAVAVRSGCAADTKPARSGCGVYVDGVSPPQCLGKGSSDRKKPVPQLVTTFVKIVQPLLGDAITLPQCLFAQVSFPSVSFPQCLIPPVPHCSTVLWAVPKRFSVDFQWFFSRTGPFGTVFRKPLTKNIRHNGSSILDR